MANGKPEISDLDDGLIERLRVRAAMAGHSMEDEACEILRRALCADEVAGGKNLFREIDRRFARLGGIDLPEIPRDPDRDPPDFSGPEFESYDR